MSQSSHPPQHSRRPEEYGIGSTRFEIKNLDQRWFTDVYHYMLAVSWLRLLIVFFLVYCGTNGVFAFLYWIGGNDIANARPGLQLDKLDIGENLVGNVGASDLALAPCLQQLKVLQLDRCEIELSGARWLVNSPFVETLCVMNVNHNSFRPEGLWPSDVRQRELHAQDEALELDAGIDAVPAEQHWVDAGQ